MQQDENDWEAIIGYDIKTIVSVLYLYGADKSTTRDVNSGNCLYIYHYTSNYRSNSKILENCRKDWSKLLMSGRKRRRNGGIKASTLYRGTVWKRLQACNVTSQRLLDAQRNVTACIITGLAVQQSLMNQYNSIFQCWIKTRPSYPL